ncbi:MAG: methyltransferase domain-containing protein [Acidimicrobiales bacterium]
MDLDDLRCNWDALGEQDPLWAILSDPDKSGGRWDLEEFLRLGVSNADGYVERLRALGRRTSGRVLDFGCGVGRVTQGFAAYFEECVGVDIAASMIGRAGQLNRFGQRVHYVLNERDDLARFPDDHFDLVFSMLVLQHMPESLSTGYIREFLRVCAPGGAVVFQIPSRIRIHELPATGCSAAIDAVVPATMVAGGRVEVTATVRNTSTDVWSSGPGWYLALGNHWLGADGQEVQLDDGRASLEHDVDTGAVTDITLAVTAPVSAGRYVLELDMVQELVCWFAQRGSPTLRAEVDVVAESTGEPCPSGTDSPPSPVIEMYSIPSESVLALIESCGGRVLAVDADELAPDFDSFTYFVAKDAST